MATANVRTDQHYLTWRSDAADLTMPGKVFHVPEEDRYDGLAGAPPPAGVVARCTNARVAHASAMGGWMLRCFVEGEEPVPFPATAAGAQPAVHRVPFPAARLGGTTHTVIAAKEIPVGRLTACHGVTTNLTVCHDLAESDAARLWRVTTRSGPDAASGELSVLCHNGTTDPAYRRGCHVLAPGDAIFTGM